MSTSSDSRSDRRVRPTRLRRLHGVRVGVVAVTSFGASTLAAGSLIAPSLVFAAPPADEDAAAASPPVDADFVPPTRLNEVKFEYPEALRTLQPPPSGRISLTYVVSVDGTPTEVTVVKGVHPDLDAAAIAAVQGLRFEAATYRGQAVEVTLSIDIDVPVPAPAEPEAPEVPGEGDGDGDGEALDGGETTTDAPTPDEAAAGPVRIEGSLLEAGVRAGVPNAKIIALPAGELPVGRVRQRLYEAEVEPEWQAQTMTDADGRFALRGVPDGKVRLVFLAQGYERLEWVVDVPPGKALSVKYFQRRYELNPYKTTVDVERIEQPEVTQRTISLAEINTVPGTQGDALKAIQNFPGVARPPFGAGLLIIRGSAPGDSAIFLAQHEIPILFHFGGLTSVFNSDILAQIDFIPGNFDSRYGDATGGVINVVPRKGRRDGFHGYVDSDVFDTGVLLEGPLGRPKKKPKGSFIISGRRSYIDFILPRVIPEDAGLNFTLAPRYWDYQMLFDQEVKGGDLSVRLFGSSDKTVLAFQGANDQAVDDRNRFEQSVYFARADLSYRKTIGGWDFLVTPSYLYSAFDIAAVSVFDFKLQFNTLSTRAEVARQLSKRAAVRFGTEFIGTQFNIDLTAPPLSDGQASDQILTTSSSGWVLRPAIYTTATLQPVEKLFIFPGVRVTTYTGVDEVAIDPRVRFAANVARRTTIKGGVGLYSQAPDPAELDATFGNPNLRPEKALHSSIGVAQSFDYDVELEITGFHKHLWDLVVGSEKLVARDGVPVPLPETFANTGRGRIYGLELLLRKNLTKNAYAWLSYTLMRSELQRDRGEPYTLFDFDQTHILTVLGSYRLPRGWQIGARFRLVSGNPFTPCFNGVFGAEDGGYACIQAPLNSGRNPAFHQLDLRVDKQWINKRTKVTAYLDILNLYNRQNQEFVNYSFNFQTSVPVTSLPIVPSIGLKVEF